MSRSELPEAQYLNLLFLRHAMGWRLSELGRLFNLSQLALRRELFRDLRAGHYIREYGRHGGVRAKPTKRYWPTVEGRF